MGMVAPDHGDLFPLPSPCDVEDAPKKDLGRRCVQRILRRRQHQAAAINAVSALNECMTGSRSFSTRKASACQLSALENIWNF